MKKFLRKLQNNAKKIKKNMKKQKRKIWKKLKKTIKLKIAVTKNQHAEFQANAQNREKKITRKEVRLNS